MSQTVLFGYTGYVGGWLLRHYNFNAVYNSTNVETAVGTTVDVLFFAGLPAAKWYANLHPDEDWQNVCRVMDVLRTVTVRQKFVLISTIDVYGDLVAGEPDEKTPISCADSHAYGLHRKRFEDFVVQHFQSKVCVIRLPGLFGDGLKKNIIHDLINNAQSATTLALNSTYQWFNMQHLAEVMDLYMGLHDQSGQATIIVNVAPEPIPTAQLIEALGGDVRVIDNGKQGVHYNVKSLVYRSPPATETLRQIVDYARFEKQKQKQTKYRKGVSNLAYGDANDWAAWDQLCYGVFKMDYFEFAPTKLWSGAIGGFDWDKVTDFVLPCAFHLPFYAMQSLTYGRNFNIFVDFAEAITHFGQVVKLALKFGVKRLVFGCPKNRWVPEAMTRENAEASAALFFQQLYATHLVGTDIVLCVENNSEQYKCNFLTTPDEVAALVRKVDRTSNIQMLFDVGNALMEGWSGEQMAEFLLRNSDILGHVHVSEPHMKPFRAQEPAHAVVAAALQCVGYNQSITLEMMPAAEGIRITAEAIAQFASIY